MAQSCLWDNQITTIKSPAECQLGFNWEPSNSNFNVPTRPLSPNIEAWSFDRVFNMKKFYGKGMQKICSKNQSHMYHSSILVNSPKQPIDVRDFWKNVILKETMKKVTLFFLCTQSLFMDKIMKNKKVRELVICFFKLQNMFTKFHFLVRPFKSGNWKEKEKK